MAPVEAWEGSPPDVWCARWGVPEVEIHASIGSTNDRARGLAELGAEPWTVVIAEQQTAGRGREGRRWESPPRTGLWMSLVSPPLAPADRSFVPLRTGLAVCRAVERAAPGLRAGIKWPNDVFVAGRKAGGILCESGPGGLVIGIGVNVRRTAFPPELAATATSLEEAAGTAVERAGVARAIVDELRALFAARRGLDDVMGELAARDVLAGRRIATAAGEVGVARGIDPDGALRVEVGPGQVRRVMGGGVRVIEG